MLAPWQKQKDSEDPSSIIKAIRWQRTCLLSLLQLTQLVLQYPALDATVSLTELVNTATKWLQDGIKAVCGQLVEQKPAKEKAAGQVAAKPVAAASEEDSPRGIININRPDARYVQVSGCALQDVQHGSSAVTAAACLLSCFWSCMAIVLQCTNGMHYADAAAAMYSSCAHGFPPAGQCASTPGPVPGACCAPCWSCRAA